MTIAEVANDLTPDTLRYYERIGLIPGVSRASGGIRNYFSPLRTQTEPKACRLSSRLQWKPASVSSIYEEL